VAYSPPKRTWRRRLAHSLKGWSRVTFSRESYITSLKSLLWVVPLTVLIWVYAEREQVTTLPNVTINVAPPVGVPGRLLARFAPGTIHTIHAELKGPQSSAEEAKEILESGTIALDLERDLTPGDHTIVIADVLNRDSRIIAKGAEVRNCVPAEVTVTVEKLSEKLLDVKVRPEDAKGLPPLVFVPAKVKVVIPDSVYNKAETDNRLFVYPNLKPYADELAQAGAHNLHVALLPGFEDALDATTISPATITATFDRATTEDKFPFGTFSVFAGGPNTPRADQYKAVPVAWGPGLPDAFTIQNVTVIGPQDKIEEIRKRTQEGPYGPHAFFDVDYSGDPQTPRAPAPLHFVLPAGVRPSDEDAKRTIEYKLVPRTPTNQ